MCCISLVLISVGGFFVILLFRDSPKAKSLFLCLIFVYRDLTSIMTRIASYDTILMSLILFWKSVVSCM